jgi:indolepyruvate ferredoxin oxidoreductase beta subunit
VSAPAQPRQPDRGLGGEGGGVLPAGLWRGRALRLSGAVDVDPGRRANAPGATTYYIEILPAPPRELAGRRPVLSLNPGVGDIDLLVASELMEAARAVAQAL